MIRLAGIAHDNWIDVEGYALTHGTGSLETLSISQFCSFMWYMIAQSHEDETALERTKAKLWKPPKGETATHGPWSREAEKKGFDSLKSQLGV